MRNRLRERRGDRKEETKRQSDEMMTEEIRDFKYNVSPTCVFAVELYSMALLSSFCLCSQMWLSLLFGLSVAASRIDTRASVMFVCMCSGG